MKNRDISYYLSHGQLNLIRKHQLAELLGVSLSTIYRMHKNNQLPPPLLTPNRHIQGWTMESIEKWLKTYQ